MAFVSLKLDSDIGNRRRLLFLGTDLASAPGVQLEDEDSEEGDDSPVGGYEDDEYEVGDAVRVLWDNDGDCEWFNGTVETVTEKKVVIYYEEPDTFAEHWKSRWTIEQLSSEEHQDEHQDEQVADALLVMAATPALDWWPPRVALLAVPSVDVARARSPHPPR